MRPGPREHTRTLDVATGDRPSAVVVCVLGASAAPASFRLSDGTCTVAAQRGMDIVIESNSVSRKHLSLTLVPEGIRVEDLGSRNGTFYLGQRIERAILLPGARILLEALGQERGEELLSFLLRRI